MGNAFRPRIEAHQPKTQATPLSGDILTLLRSAIEGGTIGEGLTAHQQEAGAGVRDFIDARQTPDAFMALMGPLREAFNLQTEKAVGGMREGMAPLGARMGTSAGRVEGQMRGERDLQLDSLLSQLFLQEQGALLQALGMQHGMGQSNMQPAFDFGAMGIMPEQLMVRDSSFLTAMKGLSELMQGAGSVWGAAKMG